MLYHRIVYNLYYLTYDKGNPKEIEVFAHFSKIVA